MRRQDPLTLSARFFMLPVYFTTRTGQGQCLMTLWLTDPMANSCKAFKPRLPTMTKSMSWRVA